MAKVTKRSPAPLYLAAAVWLVFGLFLSLYRPSDLLLCAGLSILAGVLGKKLFPDKVYEVPDPVEPETTLSPELDELVKERDKALAELKRLNEGIGDPRISAQIDRLGSDTRMIVKHVIGHPEKLSQIRKFMNYYLPTTLKLLGVYDRMDETGISGENIDATKEKVERMMETIVVAFDKQLDALFADEALDISTDITVMENLLRQEGLGGERPFATGG